jgi:hypothetical protein
MLWLLNTYVSLTERVRAFIILTLALSFWTLVLIIEHLCVHNRTRQGVSNVNAGINVLNTSVTIFKRLIGVLLVNAWRVQIL